VKVESLKTGQNRSFVETTL